MKQNHFYINGEEIKQKIDFYIKLDEILDFEHYVEGSAGVPVLDVLWDVMTCGAGLNCVLHWKNSEISKMNLGEEYFNLIIETLRDAENYPWHQWPQYAEDVPFKLILE